MAEIGERVKARTASGRRGYLRALRPQNGVHGLAEAATRTLSASITSSTTNPPRG
jgi:hypothetical protein